MHNRKKLQKKETSTPIPKKYLSMKSLRGLCAVLGEKGCFYVNHSGVIRESLAKIREGLNQKKKKKERKKEKCLKIDLSPGSNSPCG